MGCGGSKMEMGGDAGEGLTAVRRRVEEFRRRRRFGHGTGRLRKDSMVSTAGLLHPEEEEDDATTVTTEDATTVTTEDASDVGSPRSDHACRHCGVTFSAPADDGGASHSPLSTMTTPPPVVEVDSREAVATETVSVAPRAEAGVAEPDGAAGKLGEKGGKEKEGEEKQEREDKEEDKNKKEGVRELEKAAEEDEGERRGVERAALRRGAELRGEEELPGSPSFRVYFQESVRECIDDDSVKQATTAAAGKTDGQGKPRRNDSIQSCNSQESEGKISKKHKSKRFKPLTRGSSAVYGLFNVRSCYSHHHGNTTNSSSH